MDAAALEPHPGPTASAPPSAHPGIATGHRFHPNS